MEYSALQPLSIWADRSIAQWNFADVGDVNGDGIPDIVFAYGGDGACGGSGTPSGFITLLGNADGTFKPGIFSPWAKRSIRSN